MKTNDANLLIDAVVNQTVILIAHLATTGGMRAPLVQVANQVFLGLVRELHNQGVTQAVSADMFGMALRTYQRRKQRMVESATDSGRSLWEAIYSHIQQKGSASRADIEARFRYDDESVLRGVLHDLVEMGFVARAGRGHQTRYLALQDAELPLRQEGEEAPLDTTTALLWVLIYRQGPVARAALLEQLAIPEAELDRALESLLQDGRVAREPDQPEPVYRCESYVIPFDSPVAWGASVFDHYQAMVGAICHKLRMGANRAQRADTVGGSTFAFDLWDDHPFEAEVLGLLGELRGRAQALRERVDRYNALHEEAAGSTRRVLFYLGQNVIDDQEV
jgi:hypothetical protein